MGLGKKRSKLGEWLDKREVKQEILVKAGVSRGTVTSACNDPDYVPSGTNMQRILKALREVDPSLKASRFWDL